MSLRSTSLRSFQPKIGHKAACQNPTLSPNMKVVFLASHLEMLDWRRLPRPTADSGCDDKPILGLARALSVYSRRGSVPVLECRAAIYGQPYKAMGLGGSPGGWGFSWPQQKLTQCAPAMDKHSCLLAIPRPGMGFPLLLPPHTLLTRCFASPARKAYPAAPPSPVTPAPEGTGVRVPTGTTWQGRRGRQGCLCVLE